MENVRRVTEGIIEVEHIQHEHRGTRYTFTYHNIKDNTTYQTPNKRRIGLCEFEFFKGVKWVPTSEDITKWLQGLMAKFHLNKRVSEYTVTRIGQGMFSIKESFVDYAWPIEFYVNIGLTWWYWWQSDCEVPGVNTNQVQDITEAQKFWLEQVIVPIIPK